jgi:segregation and condensation protein A
MEDAFVVRVEEFEGPLEVLLSLIEERKVLINDISLSEVTESYLEYINTNHQELPELVEFLSIASTLLLIKSKSLLPTLDLTLEEESSIRDLTNRLEYYASFQEFVRLFSNRLGESPLYNTQYKKESKSIAFAPLKISAHELSTYAKNICLKIPKPEKKPEVKVHPTITLEEIIQRIQYKVEQGMEISLQTLSGSDRIEVIVSFLAILELAKQGIINVRQSDQFGDITLESSFVRTPSYGVLT